MSNKKEFSPKNAMEDVIREVDEWSRDWARYDREKTNKPKCATQFAKTLSEKYAVGYKYAEQKTEGKK